MPQPCLAQPQTILASFQANRHRPLPGIVRLHRRSGSSTSLTPARSNQLRPGSLFGKHSVCQAESGSWPGMAACIASTADWRCCGRACNRVHRPAIPAASWASRCAVPSGSTPTSSQALAASIPTHASSIMSVTPPCQSGSRAPATVRVKKTTGVTPNANVRDRLPVQSLRLAVQPAFSQLALQQRTPLQAMKDWQTRRPDLFVKRIVNRPGLDSYVPGRSSA